MWCLDRPSLPGRRALSAGTSSTLAGPEALAIRQEELREALHRAVDDLDLDRFLSTADRDVPRSLKTLNLGLSDPPPSGIMVRPMLRRRLPLPEGSTQLRHGPATPGADTSRTRGRPADLLDRDASTLAGLIEALPALPAQDISDAVSGLARNVAGVVSPKNRPDAGDQLPGPGSAEKYASNLPATPLNASAASSGVWPALPRHAGQSAA